MTINEVPSLQTRYIQVHDVSGWLNTKHLALSAVKTETGQPLALHS